MTSEELIKSLTPPQRAAFERLQRGYVCAPLLSSERRVYGNLAKRGLAVRVWAGGGLRYELTDLGKLVSGPIWCVPA